MILFYIVDLWAVCGLFGAVITLYRAWEANGRYWGDSGPFRDRLAELGTLLGLSLVLGPVMIVAAIYAEMDP